MYMKPVGGSDCQRVNVEQFLQFIGGMVLALPPRVEKKQVFEARKLR